MAKVHKKPVEHNGVFMPLDIQSPIVRIRMLKGLTLNEMAVVLQVADTVVSNMENGSAEISESSQEALTGLGLDGAEIAKEQEEFIEKKRAWLLERFEARFIKGDDVDV